MSNLAESQQIELKFFEKINWNHVFYFTVVASAGSLREAAKTLEIQPSTLSEQISALEKTLKVSLFSRRMRRLSLTEEGQKLYRYSKSMFETGQRLMDVISPNPVGFYPITVGIVPSASARQVFETMINFSLSQSENRVRINRASHDQMEELMLDAKMDFGFTDRKTERKDIVQHVIFEGRIKFFGSKEFSGKPLTDALKGKALFICRAAESQFSVIETLTDTYGLHPRTIVSCEYISMVQQAVEMGAGIAALSEKHFASPQSNLIELKTPPGFPDLTEKVFLTWASGSENAAAIRALRSFIHGSKTSAKIFDI